MFTLEQIRDIENAVKNPPKRVISRKLNAISLVAHELDFAEIAQITRYAVNYIYEIVADFKALGVAALCDKRPGGNHRTFSPEKEAEIFRNVQNQAQDGRFPRISEIREAVEKEAETTIPQSTFYKMVHRNGGRKLKPRGQNPKKASEAEINASKKLTQNGKKFA